MGERRQAGKLFLYVTSHPDQLSLAIPAWVGTMNSLQQKLGRKQAYSAVH